MNLFIALKIFCLAVFLLVLSGCVSGSHSLFNEKKDGVKTCAVTPEVFNRPLLKKSGRKIDLLKEDTKIDFIWQQGKLKNVLIDEKDMFRYCQHDGELLNYEMSKKILTLYKQSVTDTDIAHLDGSRMYVCHTLDEDMYFFIKDGEYAYVGGYGGPSPSIPSAFIGLSCN